MIEYKVKVHNNGERFWYLNDKLHREDGPAVEYASGTKIWYREGKRHREDGPAFEGASGTKTWYLNGIFLTEKQHRERTQPAPSCDGRTVTIDGVEYELKRV